VNKRYTDRDIWEQTWWIELDPKWKNVWRYLSDKCDTSGIWKIDMVKMARDIGYDRIDLAEFIEAVNRDYDPITGEPVQKERVRRVDGKLWLTGFIVFQYGTEAGEVSASVPAVKGAINRLSREGLYQTAIDCEYFTVTASSEGLLRVSKGCQGLAMVTDPSVTLDKGLATHKDKDKDSINSSSSESEPDENVQIYLPVYPPEFETFCDEYPGDCNRAKVYAHWQKLRASLVDPVHLITAAKHYASECTRLKKDPQYIIHAHNWLANGEWRDYIAERKPKARASPNDGLSSNGLPYSGPMDLSGIGKEVSHAGA
jgi:hypothetical protein